MKNVLFLLNLVLVIIASVTLIGCGTRTGTGAVRVELTNATTSNLVGEMKSLGVLGLSNQISLESTLLGVTPTIYQMKLVTMYIVEDIDPVTLNNMGAGAHIWASNKCDSELRLCGIAPDAGEHQVDYFDFAQGTDAVNAILNSYRRDTRDAQIGPGTYRYLRIDFTGRVTSENENEPNLKFGTSVVHEVRAQKQAYTVTLPEPMVLAEGDSFTVNLAYSLENRFYSSATSNSRPSEVSQDDYWTCDGSGAGVPCIVETVFVPTVTKN